MVVMVPAKRRPVVPGVRGGSSLVFLRPDLDGSLTSFSSLRLLLRLVHPLITPPGTQTQVHHVVLPLHVVSTARVEQLYGLLWIQPIHVDQVPADQVAGSVQAMCAVDSDQPVVIAIFLEKLAYGAFEAEDDVVTWNTMTGREDLHDQQGLWNVLQLVVAFSVGEVDDQTQFLVLLFQRVQKLPVTKDLRGRELTSQSLLQRNFEGDESSPVQSFPHRGVIQPPVRDSVLPHLRFCLF